MDLITLAAAKNYANKVTAGFKSVELNGMNLIFTLLDDTKATIAIPAPADGISVQNLSIDTDGSLLCHMSDGSVIDAGYVPTVDPDLTNYYTKEEINKKLKNKIITLTGDYYITGYNDSYADLSTDDCASIGSFILETGVKYEDRDRSKLYEASYYIKNYNTMIKPFNVSIYTSNLAGVNVYGYRFNCYFILGDSNKTTGNGNSTTIEIVSFYVYLNRETFEPIRGTISWGQVQGYLSKSNTTTYTPTSDYHPATKKYVDDSIANIDVPGMDLSNYYTKEEVDAAIATAIAQALGTVETELASLTTPEEGAE